MWADRWGTNWPAPNVWVFIAQMVQHCSANAEAMSSNPVEVPVSFFFFFYLQLLKLQLPVRPDDHIFIWNLYFCRSHHLQVKKEIRYGWGEENTTEFVLANLKIYLHKIVWEKKKDHVIDKEDENDNPLYYLFISPLCNQNVLFRCNLWSSLLISENISYHWFPKE